MAVTLCCIMPADVCCVVLPHFKQAARRLGRFKVISYTPANYLIKIYTATAMCFAHGEI